jgi:hypothetical protein
MALHRDPRCAGVFGDKPRDNSEKILSLLFKS